MSKRRTFKDFERYLKETYESLIADRDSTRGTGVYLGESIDGYYITVGKIMYIQNMASFFNIPLKPYDPYETDEDDNGFNYYATLAPIGRKEGYKK